MQPETVYQLSLRLGTSFVATLWALVAQNAISSNSAKGLQKAKVKDLKRLLAPEDLITNPWAAVWSLTENDTGTCLEAGPDDLFAVQVQDNASGGYLWELVDAGESVEIVSEVSASIKAQATYGGLQRRTVFLRIQSAGVHQLLFLHRRRWSQERLEEIRIKVDNHGKERGGFPRRLREAALAEA